MQGGTNRSPAVCVGRLEGVKAVDEDEVKEGLQCRLLQNFLIHLHNREGKRSYLYRNAAMCL